MIKTESKTIFNKLRAVIVATVMATAGLTMVSAPANAGATSTPISVTYDAGGSSGTGYVNPASNGAADAGSATALVANGSPAGGTGNFGSVFKCDWNCWDYGRYGGAYIWKNSTNPDFSLMPTGAGTTGTTISVKAYATGAQVGKKVMRRRGFAKNEQPNQVVSSKATLLSGWNTYSLTVAPDVNASHRYWAAYLVFDEYNWTVGDAGVVWIGDTSTYYFDNISFPDAGTQSPSTCTAAKPCSSRIDWAGSTGVSQGFHNVKAETDISVTNSYYAKGVGVYQAYAKAGSTFTLKFLVKDENGQIRPGLAVALRANKGYSGSTAHWIINGTAVSPAGVNDGGIFSGTTDSNGYVSFTVTNTDTNPQPIADPTIEDTDTSSFGTFALLQDSGDTTEALDIIEIHAYGLGFKIGNDSSYNAGISNGYLAADGSAVLQIPFINYNSSFKYTVKSSKGEAYLAGKMIVVTGAKDGEAVTVTITMTDGVETATKTFGAKFSSTLSMKSPASISYDPVKKTVTCNNASYTKTPTDTAYYLYLNRVLKGGKKFGTTTGLQWMYRGVNLSSEGVTATSATWNVPASWNTSNIARVYCETQAFAGNDEVRSLSAGFTIPRLGKYVPRSSTPTKLKPTAVTMRLVDPALTKDAAGKAVNYFDWTYNSVEANWAQYYGKNLAFIYKYVNVGATTTLKWKVTDSDSGSALDNFPVSLIINKNYGGMQNATFSYVVSGEKKVAAASPANNGTGETVIAGMTDDEGYVTFVITNTNTAAQAEAKPAALNAMQPAGGTDLHSQITLTAGLAQTKESIDLIEFHIVKP